jgi:large exoprotein involved in heme utilization and adhesion
VSSIDLRRAPTASRGILHYSRRSRDFHGSVATLAIVAALAATHEAALAGPNGGTVVGGSASISQAGATTNINQSSANAIINWQGFSVGKNETCRFPLRSDPGFSSRSDPG